MELTPEQEEWATYFAKYLGTEHVKKPQFCANFFKDWLKFLNPPGSKTKVLHLLNDHIPSSSHSTSDLYVNVLFVLIVFFVQMLICKNSTKFKFLRNVTLLQYTII